MYEGRNVHFTTNNKPLCSFSGKLCNLRRLNGYAFCVRHILEDPSAPFKQCLFTVKTSGLRCTSAIPGREDREYCSAHMQVMGIIPKKERKKKPEPSFLPDGHGIHNLDSFKLPNGYNSDEKSNSHKFSASKMFPELAGKLSLDNQKTSDVTPEETVNNSLNKPSSKGTASNLSSKRSRKPTRKYLSILKKKQLGLLTDEEAKASLTTLGCKAYHHYANAKIAESALLTPLIDSSDDESLAPSPLVTHNLRTSNSSFSFASTLDLNTELSDSSDSDGEGLLALKRACLQLSHAALLNQEVTEYTKKFTSCFLETMTDNLNCAAIIAGKIRPPQLPTQVPTTPIETRSYVDSSVKDSRQRCTYSDEDDKRCRRRPIPLMSHCSRHIMHATEQRLFQQCSFTNNTENGEETKICAHPAIDTGQSPALCHLHLPHFVDPFEIEQDLNLRRKKKKSKPFAFRRAKKRKKNVRPQKPMPPTSDIGKLSCISSSSEISMNNPADIPKSSSPSVPKPEENELDSDNDNILSPLDKSLLPLGHDESKILDDNEIDEVLNEEGFMLFPESVKNEEGLDLTEAEADLIFSGNSDELLGDLKGELPDDITDAILHVEYEAEMEKQQQQQRQQHLQPQSHNIQQTMPQQQQQTHRMLQQQQSAGVYEMTGGLDGYAETEYHSMHQSYNHQGPPPDYPGATKLLPTSHLNVHNNIGYMHEQNARYTHHQIHPKISTSANNPQMLIRQSSFHLPQANPLSLPASSSQLNSNPMPINRMGRLPPVSTITMQPWHASESTPYQNGFHSPTEHHIYQHNGALPSPPHYQAPRGMYTTQLYNNGAYSINRALRPPHPQRVNMPMQQ